MGIWRQQNTAQKRRQPKDTYSLFENADPFEHDESFLGSFRAPTSPRDAATVKAKKITTDSRPKAVRRDETSELLDSDFSRINRGRSSRNVLLYGVLALAITASGFAAAKYRPWAAWGSQELVYAYFEVRAVDGAGRPVAGASVKNAGKKVGTTDSFGEWRRYMRVPLGSTVPITISKATTGEPLYATKNFAVPPEKPEKSDMELRASVQLQTGSAGIVASAAPTITSTKELKQPVANDTLVAVAQPEKKFIETTTTPAQELARDADVAAQESPFNSSHESIWFEVQSGAVLQNAIMPALQQRAKELGLRVDSSASWRVRLTSLIDPPRVIGADGAGLFEITSIDQSTNARQFLRNYQSDVRTTARGILYVLSHQVNKNVAIHAKDNRWVAVLPKDSSDFWKVAGGMSLMGAGREWLVGIDAYADAKFQGYFLASNENPCAAGKTSCELKTRSFAETPAVPTWTRLKLKLLTQSKEKDSMKVFVSGYETKQTGDNVLEYWGQDRAKANVTVVQNGKVIHRVQIVNDLRQPVNVALGVASMSRR